MFGMLDYRAHKLLWLICAPITLAAHISFLFIIPVAIAIAQWTEYALWLKIIIGYVAFEALGLIVQIIFAIIGWIIQRIFFWTIDIVPHDGADAAEAKSVVTHGKIIRLAKKLSRDIEHWTYEDTDEFVTLFNWRARWFFNTVERYRIRVRILKRHFEETGRQPADLDAAEVKSLVGHLDVGWGEWLITTPYTFKSIVAAVTILVALVAINSK